MILGNARIVCGDRVLNPGWLRVTQGRIAELGEGSPSAGAERVDHDLAGRWLVPGFVDMHVHGAVGHSFDEADADETVVEAITRHHLAHGTTTMVASLVSAPVDALARRLRSLAEHVRSGSLAGVHLEGPFLSDRHRGAHDPRNLRAPDADALDTLLDTVPGTLRMLTIAPELPGALDAIKRVTGADIVAAVGHTSADYETTLAAIEAGATVATHLYNGMPPIRGREPGPVPALLDDPRVTVELIADGFHLHPATLRHASTTANGRFALVTDAMAATGCGDGDYELGGRPVQVRDGRAQLADGSSLAGSTLTLDRALRVAAGSGIGFRDALAAVTSTPARALGLGHSCGTIAVGRAADLVVLDENYAVRAVIRAGRRVVTH